MDKINKYEPRMLLGRLSNGCESDHGKKIHACEPGKTAAYCRGKALCGAEPGKRSAGWSDIENSPVNCSKCLKNMKDYDMKDYV